MLYKSVQVASACNIWLGTSPPQLVRTIEVLWEGGGVRAVLLAGGEGGGGGRGGGGPLEEGVQQPEAVAVHVRTIQAV